MSESSATAAPAVVEDRTVEFLISSSSALPDLGSLRGRDFRLVHWRDAFDDYQADVRRSVCERKSALDGVPPDTYTRVRNTLFPLAASGAESRQVLNRAGHKLSQSMDATGVWQQLTKVLPSQRRIGSKSARAPAELLFADVCGGPGAFTQTIFTLSAKHHLRPRAVGMTLKGVDGLDWYPALLADKRFTATYGLDGTGDIYQLPNIEALRSLTAGSAPALVVADGGFSVDMALANFQETISSRILYGQWLAALKLLRPGGCFVLKVFDTFSPLSRALLFLSTFLYHRVHVVKPKHSRVVNSERYLVAIDYKGLPDDGWAAYLDECYVKGFPDNDHVPEVIPPEWLARDAEFVKSLDEMNVAIAQNQCVGLQMIIDAVEKERHVSAEAVPVKDS